MMFALILKVILWCGGGGLGRPATASTILEAATEGQIGAETTTVYRD